MARQFIAVRPNGLDKNPELKRLLGKLKRTSEQREQQARWTPPALWHVSLQFLGENSDTDRAIAVMEKWNPPKLNLRLHGLGAFPNGGEGRLLWIGVQESQELLDAQSGLAALLKEFGYPEDSRPFQPHLTLARFRHLMNLEDLIALGGRKHFGDYPIGEVVLFESVLQGNIIKYVPVHRKPVSDSGWAPTK